VHRLSILAWAVLALGGARAATAQRSGEVCRYTPELAEAMYQAYPAADADGDGVLSRDEACDYQAELRKRAPAAPADATDARSTLDDASLLAEPLCCNCDESEGRSGPLTSSEDVSCTREEEGVTP
nr:hypothetical protein [Deltaproteobacteria bacterium]